MSEHTAEYVLVNDIVRRLSPTFQNLVPIFFWATREGNRAAVQSMQGLNFQLLMCFARRPKVDYPTSNELFIKINDELMQYRKACAPLNIPVIAGVPLVKSLPELRLNSTCAWFDLARFVSLGATDCYLKIAPDGSAALADSSRAVTGSLTDRDIEELVGSCPLFTWSRVIEHMREVRWRVSNYNFEKYGYPRFPFIGGYKPFFVLAVADDFNGKGN